MPQIDYEVGRGGGGTLEQDPPAQIPGKVDDILKSTHDDSRDVIFFKWQMSVISDDEGNFVISLQDLDPVDP